MILDRCNARAEDRVQWLRLAMVSKRDKGIVAIHFATPAEECIRRIAQRVGHPTLPPERGPKAVASFAKALEPPTLAEGFERVHVVRSYEEANALMLSYGATPPPLPPPVPLAAARPGGKYGAREWEEIDDGIDEGEGLKQED